MRYRCALVTGASSGLGEEFARQLARECGTIVLVARSEDRLEEVAAELKSRNPSLTAAVFVKDLTAEDERLSLCEECAARGFEPDFLINNAGRGDYGDFSSSEWKTTRQMMDLNMQAVVHLTHLFIPGLVRQRGSILNVSSLAGDMPIPDFAVYAATKAFVSSFTEALRLELREDGVKVTALCPGPIKTGFGEQAMRDGSDKLPVEKLLLPRRPSGGRRAQIRRRQPGPPLPGLESRRRLRPHRPRPPPRHPRPHGTPPPAVKKRWRRFQTAQSEYPKILPVIRLTSFHRPHPIQLLQQDQQSQLVLQSQRTQSP